MKPIIEIKNLSKQYRIGKVGTGSLHHDVNRWWHKARGKEDPYMRIGDSNDRTTKATIDYVWALKDISFSVQPGEVLGIIGRNGAGKSTLLKILSRITAPTTGSYTLRGRVASLLEVGTGMHPDLTGRENIYLNGAILGMRRKEIDRKLDAIVDFAGVERYIDTPVKRYSSGMHVRLGFAVAAHLEPDILIVDEVLAVGDAEFQKKCLGKMKDVSTEEGRTILFVSHNMQAISSLTTSAIIIQKGELAFIGNTSLAIANYIKGNENDLREYTHDLLKDKPKITRIKINTSRNGYLQIHKASFSVEIDINFPKPTEGIALSFQIFDNLDNAIVHSWIYASDIPIGKRGGLDKIICSIPIFRLYMGSYYLKVHFANTRTHEKYETIERICPFEVDMYGTERLHPWNPNACKYVEDSHWSLIN